MDFEKNIQRLIITDLLMFLRLYKRHLYQVWHNGKEVADRVYYKPAGALGTTRGPSLFKIISGDLS